MFLSRTHSAQTQTEDPAEDLQQFNENDKFHREATSEDWALPPEDYQVVLTQPRCTTKCGKGWLKDAEK